MKRITLRKSDIRNLNIKIASEYGVDDFFSKKDFVEIVDDRFIIKDSVPCFFKSKDSGRYVPTLKLLLEGDFLLKAVVVDMGAVKFVVSGADIMRPGIVSIPEGLKEGDFIAVVDENNHKPLAIGQMMFDSETVEKMESGKVVKNVHRVGDEIWVI